MCVSYVKHVSLVVIKQCLVIKFVDRWIYGVGNRLPGAPKHTNGKKTV